VAHFLVVLADQNMHSTSDITKCSRLLSKAFTSIDGNTISRRLHEQGYANYLTTNALLYSSMLKFGEFITWCLHAILDMPTAQQK
jgi:hypothetical protein